MGEDDGIALTSISHPVAPWWQRLWMWLFHRGIDLRTLETIDIEIKEHNP